MPANRDRDAWEVALVRGAIRRGMPVLGICRGAQVVNVALGGTLHQHLPDVIGHTRHQLGNAVFSTSAVHTVPGTRLAELIGESSDAQCYHHQAIDRLGDGLVIAAQDSDGVIEAVEIPGENFVLAVQWHPEERLDDLRLFVGVGAGRDRLCNRKGECVTSSVLINPATEKELRTVEQTDRRAGVDDAVARAKAAQRDWAEAGARPTGPLRCGRSRPSSMRTSTSSPRSRSPTPAIRSATRSGRPATSATCCSSTPRARNVCPASRFRWQAASTSPSTSRSASSA